jgi:hypothetical protein
MGNEFERDKDGMLICPECSKPMDAITQVHYKHLEWDESLKKYRKTEWPGDDEDPICCECGNGLDSKYASLFDEDNKLDKARKIIGGAIDELEKYDKKDEGLIEKIGNILRSARRECRG